jgi:electron transport complex protein RnfD
MKFEGVLAGLSDLLTGATGGCLGETSAGLLILCGLGLALRRTFDWRIPVAILVTVAVFSGILHAMDSSRFPPPVFMLLSGGLLFGTVFMATDPVTSPIAPKGALVFGAGVGFLVVLIRLFGGFPEGTMYAILLMNAATPLLDRRTQPLPFGRGKSS